MTTWSTLTAKIKEEEAYAKALQKAKDQKAKTKTCKNESCKRQEA